MDKPWKVIFAFVGVFVAGAVFGGFFTLRSSRGRLEQELEAVRLAAQTPVNVSVPVVTQTTSPAVPVPEQSKPLPEPPKPVAVAAAAPAPSSGPGISPPRPPISGMLMRQFAQRLNLTNPQREKVRPILGRWGDDFQHLRQENDRQQLQYLADSVRLSERMYGDVNALLTAEQRVELEKMRRESEERVERERQKRIEAQSKNKAPKGLADPLRPFPLPDKAKSASGS